MTKGIIIYALGHENYYRMAENLAASLIANNSVKDDIKIALVCDDHNNIGQSQLFDNLIKLEEEKFIINGKVVFNNATILVYDLSPYDITIKLDADMIWIESRKPSSLFNELESYDLTFSNRGFGWGKQNSVWADEEEIKKAYKLTGEEKLYKIFGEFLYFKKTAANKKYFQKVNEIYQKPKVKCSSFSNGTMTDELAFQIACITKGIYPHKYNFTPVYNSFLGYEKLNRKYPYELVDFYAYSIGGNTTNAFMKTNYNNLAKHYFAKLGLSNPYQVVDKRNFLPERKRL